MSRKRFKGKVISDKMEKTVLVEIEGRKTHPADTRRVRSLKKFKAHDELGAKIGQKVIIEECRPLSKDKKFKVVQVGEEQKK